MRTPTSLVVLAFIGLLAGCSRRKASDNQLDLVLDENARPAAVASAVEIWGEAKAKPVSPAQGGATALLHARKRARTRKLERLPRPAPVAVRAPVETHVPVPARDPQPIAAAPAPAQPASAPAPEPTAPQPADPQPGRGRGGWPEPTDGGARFPGIPGGVIIIRGGHGGSDPCDEHGRGGIGGFPGLPGRIGRGGGIVF